MCYIGMSNPKEYLMKFSEKELTHRMDLFMRLKPGTQVSRNLFG